MSSKENKREIVAYSGQCFTIEWYYNEKRESPALEYFLQLSDDRQDKLFTLLKRLGEIGKIFDETKFRNEGDKIFAFKPHPDRYLCFFFSGRKIIITNAFEKKTQKLPKGEKEVALKAKVSYESLVKGKKYYEKL